MNEPSRLVFSLSDYVPYARTHAGAMDFSPEKSRMFSDIATMMDILTKNKYMIKFYHEDCGVYVLEYSYQDASMNGYDLVWINEDDLMWVNEDEDEDEETYTFEEAMEWVEEDMEMLDE